MECRCLDRVFISLSLAHGVLGRVGWCGGNGEDGTDGDSSVQSLLTNNKILSTHSVLFLSQLARDECNIDPFVESKLNG